MHSSFLKRLKEHLYRRIKEDLPTGDFTVPIGKARIDREGRHLSIITYGAMLYVARQAAETLESENRSSWTGDVHSLPTLAVQRALEAGIEIGGVVLDDELGLLERDYGTVARFAALAARAPARALPRLTRGRARHVAVVRGRRLVLFVVFASAGDDARQRRGSNDCTGG